MTTTSELVLLVLIPITAVLILCAGCLVVQLVRIKWQIERLLREAKADREHAADERRRAACYKGDMSWGTHGLEPGDVIEHNVFGLHSTVRDARSGQILLGAVAVTDVYYSPTARKIENRWVSATEWRKIHTTLQKRVP